MFWHFAEEIVILPHIYMKVLYQIMIRYVCPLCSKSVCDMSKVWEKLDAEIAAVPMPELYQNKMVYIFPFANIKVFRWFFLLLYWKPNMSCRYRYFAMTVGSCQKCSSMYLHRNAVIANHIILARFEVFIILRSFWI